VQNWLGRPNWLQDNSLARITLKRPVANNTYIFARRFVAAGMCLPSRCLVTSPVYLPTSRSSRSNGSTRYSIVSARSNKITSKEDEMGRACSTNEGEEECI
jgi:hypothetical protein